MSRFVFDSPIAPSGGLIFDLPTRVVVPELDRGDEGGGGRKRKRPQRDWRDLELDRDDEELMEIVTILLMADIL